MSTRSTSTAVESAPSYLGPFIAVAALYFIFGFVTNLNMGLVPYLKQIFQIHNFQNWQAMMANGAFFTAYFVCSTPSSKLIEAIGYKRTMVVSLFIQVIGALIFLPAAQQVSFPLFLTAIFVVGAGVTALQTAANPYIAILGPEHSAPFRLTLAQALNSAGGTIAPWIASAFILTSSVLDPKQVAMESPEAQHAYQVSIAHTVRMPYIVIAFGLVVMGIAIALTHLPHLTATQEFRPGKEGDAVLTRSIWKYRHTVLAAIGIFLYVGVEVGLATVMVLYFSDSQHGGLNALTTAEAQKLVLYYWLGALIGRLLGSWMLTRVKAGLLLGIFGVIAAALVAVAAVTTGTTAIGALILAGFFNSIMFPNIFALGIAGLGPVTSKGSGLIMTAVWGGALIPVLIGWISDRSSYEVALLVPVLCYLYIAFYGFVFHKPKRSATA
ncbi:MAG TPA: sugar MFS transporter [Terracidiphilus sp.]|nr:sugar MFS transporter [Terracidiphilus sp.]